MPPNLIQQLESLSGYRHIFSPQDSRASLNPVVFSHLGFTIAGRRCHVLSRVCDAGLDYTQRTNKLAHHVILDAAEVPAAGPAWLLAQPRLMQSNWAGEPRILPTGPRVPSGDSQPRVCRAWQQITGDAGWGGVLAETATGPTVRQAVLVFQPGMEMLPLLAESLALLPIELRWRVSFSTYFTKLPAGVECQWRCVVAGTPEAVAAQRTRQTGLVLDLCHPLGPATGGAYVEAARTGKPPATVVRAEHLPDAELEYALQDTGRPQGRAGVDVSVPPGVRTVRGDVVPPAASSYRPQIPPRQLAHPARKTSPRWPWVLAVLAMVLVAVGLGVLTWTLRFGPAAGTRVSQTEVAVAVPAGETAIPPNVAKQADAKAAEAKDDKASRDAKLLAEKQAACKKAADSAERAKQAAEAAKAEAAAGKKVADQTRSAAQDARAVGADAIPKQADAAATNVSKTAGDADKAGENAKNAAKSIAQLTKADSSTAEAIQEATKKTNQAADEALASTDHVRNAIKAARGTIDAIKQAVEKKRHFEEPFDLPPCAAQQLTAAASSSSHTIAQLQGIPIQDIEPLGFSEAFPEEIQVTDERQGESLGYYASGRQVPRQLIAQIAAKTSASPTFRWGDQAQHIRAKADLLRNCLLSVTVPGYSKPAIVPLRRAQSAPPLTLTLLGREAPAGPPSVDLESIPPDKAIALELSSIPGCTIEPQKDGQGKTRSDAYCIVVNGDVPLHFLCVVHEVKPPRSKRQDDTSYNKRLRVAVSYEGAGESREVIYPTDKDAKCRELLEKLNELKSGLKRLRKGAEHSEDSQQSKQGGNGDSLDRLKQDVGQFQKDLDAVKVSEGTEKQLTTLKEGVSQLNAKVIHLEQTLKSLADFEKRRPTLHYRLYITVAHYQVDLLKTK
jgi:hypothetical protein